MVNRIKSILLFVGSVSSNIFISMLYVMVALVGLPCFSQSQLDSAYNGIQFYEGLDWKEVLSKAKAEKKFIFIDCYTTWCLPCKRMEKEVYPLDQVGNYYNKNFISIKLQMDRTKNDDEIVKKKYEFSKRIEGDYKIDAYPTFLYFSPDGDLVNRAMGKLDVESFIETANRALDPKMHYETLLNDYNKNKGNSNASSVRQLARLAKSYGNKELSEVIATDFMSKWTEKDLLDNENKRFINEFKKIAKAQEIANAYINSLGSREIFTKENLDFIWNFTQNSNDRGFSIFYTHGQKIDVIFKRKNASQPLIDFIITKEEIDPVLAPLWDTKFKEPFWDTISMAITRKYNKDYGKRIVINAKLRWYNYKKNWVEFSKNTVLLVSNYGLSINPFFKNNHAWDVFQRSKDTLELKAAISWMERAVLPDDPYWSTAIDTYANLLYKIGKVKEALMWEERAVKLDPDDTEIRDNLNRMRKNLPTWPLN